MDSVSADVEMVEERMVIRSSALPGDGGPSAVMIAPWGEVKSVNGTFVVDDESAKAIISAFGAQGTEIPIDYEHQSLGGAYSSPNGQAPAAGWIRSLRAVSPEAVQANDFRTNPHPNPPPLDGGGKNALGEPGLWADVEWTESARGKLVAKEYRYLSPVVIVRKRDRRVVALHSAALTNKPAIVGMRPIINRCEGGGGELLLESSGASAPANEAMAALCLRLGLESDASLETVLVTADERLAQFTRQASERAAEELVESAMRSGKLTGNLREWAMSLAMKDRAGFEQWMGSAPVVVMLGRTASPAGSNASGGEAAVISSARRSFRAEPVLALLTHEDAWVKEALRESQK